MRIEPAEELQVLRQNHRQRQNTALASGSELKLEEVWGDSLELALVVEPSAGTEFGVRVRCAPEGEEQTDIIYSAELKTLRVDTSRSSLNPEVVQPWPQHGTSFSPNPLDGREDVRVQQAPLTLVPGEPLELRIFLDRSILEVFANKRQCVTQRIYPTRSDSLGVALFSAGGSSRITSVDVWDLAAANPW